MKRSDLTFAVVQIFVDYFAVVAAAFLAFYIRMNTNWAGDDPVLFSLADYIWVVVPVALAWLLFFKIAGMYNLRRSQRLIDELYRVFLGVSAGTMGVIIFMFLIRELFFSSRFIIIATWIIAIILITLGRFVMRRIQISLYKKGIGVNRIVVIGKNRSSGTIVDDLGSSSKKGYEIISVLDSPIKEGSTTATIEHLKKLQKKRGIDQIIQTDPMTPRDHVVKLIEFADDAKIIFKYAPDMFQTAATNIEVWPVAGIPLVELKQTPLDGWGKVAKRVMDVIGSAILIIITSPILLGTTLAVKFSSDGPVFFTCERIGQNGKPFKYFKFRSMVQDAHKLRYDPKFQAKMKNLREGSPMIKFKDDPRITSVGAFIRKYSIDELPEFFNVFIGKMSLVGPRPHEPEEVAKYKKHHKRVLMLKPGISGMPQISGRSDLDFEEEVRLDTYYIENWSLKLDFYIIMRTPFILLKKRSAL
ncbi:sugar transferase [Patescibacteria group bacterium]